MKSQLVGIDIGGTFTDFVFLVDGSLRVYKLATTARDQSSAVVDGLQLLDVDAPASIVHGTTIATNALLERRGARTALLTTEGFADLLVIGRQNRPQLYSFRQSRPPPLVPDTCRFDVPERLDASGSVLTKLEEAAVMDIAGRIAAQDIESVAIVFLHSFLNPRHEKRAAECIRRRLPDLPISLSSEILPEYREYERTATTVINAYIRPIVAHYLNRLERAMDNRTVRVMQSNGGTIGITQAAKQAARLVLSGPAGGVVGAFSLACCAMERDDPRVVTFDMGGTSTDVALCPGQIPGTAEGNIAGLPLRLPSVDIHTVGAGGGSIARVDAGGVLRVGPNSAGAEPGPVCYGRGGTEPTVSDANLVLGRLDAGAFLGGSKTIHLDVDAAREAVAQLGRYIGLSVEATALGVIRVANATMERALRSVSVERGHDPREYVLVPFGGAGPMHACDLAEALDMRHILIPPNPGVLSAFGLLMADITYESSHAVITRSEALASNLDPLVDITNGCIERVRQIFKNEGICNPAIDGRLDMRYCGQSYELEIPIQLPITETHLDFSLKAFHDAHKQRYGHAMEHEPVEVVTLRIRGTAPGARPDLPYLPVTARDIADALVAEKKVWFETMGPAVTDCYDRSRLFHGHRFHGPAMVYQYDTTIVLLPGWKARVDGWQNLWLERNT